MNAVEPVDRAPRMRREDRRRQLMAMSERVLAASGIRSLTMERLAREAGIAKPIVYGHFRNRSELLKALFEDYWRHVDERIMGARRAAGTPREMLSRTVAAYLDVMETRGAALRQLLYKVLEDPVVEAARHERDQFVAKRWAREFFVRFGAPPSCALCLGVMTRSLLESTATFVHAYGGRRQLVERFFVETVEQMLELGRRSGRAPAGRKLRDAKRKS